MNLILHDWTRQPYLCLYVKYQFYSYTRLITESIRRAGGMRSTLTSQTLHQQTTMALMRLWKRQSFSLYTSCNRIHFIYMWTYLLYAYVIKCAVATGVLFRSAISLTVWQAPSCSEFNRFNVKLFVIKVCLPVILRLMGPRNLLKMSVLSIETLLPRWVFSSSCLISISDLPSSTQTFMSVWCSAFSKCLNYFTDWRHIHNW